jgi:predicted phosphate transport protein (TIGR00153 family)
MLSKFFPKEFNFFDFFDKEMEHVEDASRLFKKIINRGEVDNESREQMRDIEHDGDKMAYAIIEHLNKTFITPFDREDIHSLAKKLDDVNDMINSIVSRMKVYKIKGQNKDLMEFSDIIEKSISALGTAIRGLRYPKKAQIVLDACREVNKYESAGDRLRDKALGELVDHEKDPIEFIKWKELYQYAETVLDICKVVAHVIETILVKQA